MNVLRLVNILSHFTAFAIYVCLIVFVLHKNPKGLINRICALTLACFAVWGLAVVFFHNAASAGEAMFWLNMASLGWGSFPVPVLWFYLLFTGHDKLLKNRLFVAAGVLLAAFFVRLQWAGCLIVDFIRQPYGWSTVWAGWLPIVVFSCYYALLIGACIFLAIDLERKARSRREKSQARLLIAGPLITLCLGSLSDIIFPALRIGVIPPAAVVFILVWAGGLGYAIFRYGLMTLTPAMAAADILETMGDALLLAKMDGAIVSANRAALGLLGCGAGELTGRRLDSVIVDEKSGGPALWREMSERGWITGRDAICLAQNGSGVPVSLSAATVKDKEGDPAGVVTVAHDMTEHRRLELDLRKSERKYRALVEHALIGIGIHQNGVLLFANPKLAALLGYAPEGVVGSEIAGMIHPDERDFVMARSRRRQAGGGEPETYELRLLKKDGNVVHTLISNAVIEYNGSPATMITVADIGDTKARKELELANKELEAFSYSVSHDLRAPLRSIDGFSQAFLDDYEDRMDAQGKEYLRRVRAASQRMARLIDDLLKLSRVTRADMSYRQVDLSAMAKAIAGELKETNPERAVEFVVAEGATAPGDASLLRAVLENLLNNAWKYTARHPRARIEFGVVEQDGRPAYFVRDDGAGFDMAYAGKLFTPFQRLHDSAEFEGTGIGLATAQRIVRRHGGRIWAEGEVEKGAVFYFTLQS